MFENIINSLINNAGRCSLCPRKCLVDRYSVITGKCGINEIKISAANLHFGEEPPISGERGSGTVFFSGCSMKCSYCQNYSISQFGYGNQVDIEHLSDMFVKLQNRGAHNINLVTPTHISHLVFQAIVKAKDKGLAIPVVYNTSGYESPDIIKLIDPLIDIYLFDMKYSDNNVSEKYSMCNDYIENNRASFEYIVNNNTNVFNDGIMQKGVIIRHLFIPSNIENTLSILDYLERFKDKIHLSLMFQYLPLNEADKYPEINRRISINEYDRVMDYFQKLNFPNGWTQDL